MKRLKTIFLLFLLLFCNVLFAIEVSLPVQEVLIYRDRAEVTRYAYLQLQPGENKLVLRDLSPVLISESLRASLPKTKLAYVSSIHSYLEPSLEYKSKEYTELQVQMQKLEQKKKELEAEVALIENEKRQLHQFQKLTAKSISEKIAYTENTPDVQKWQSILLEFRESFRSLEKQKTKIENQKIELLREKERLQKKMDLIRSLAEKSGRYTELQIYFSGKMQKRHLLKVSYIIKGCSWRPTYNLNITKEKATIEYLAEIQQESGEDWQNVKVSLSTSIPNENRVRTKLKAKELRAIVQKSQSSFFSYEKKVSQKSDAKISTSGNRQSTNRGKVESGGNSLIFRAKGRVNLNSKRELHKLLISEFSSKVQMGYLCVPKKRLRVYNYSKIRNEILFPLLPGKISIFRDAGFVGQTKIPYISSQETFKVSLGIENNIRVTYRTEKRNYKQGILAKSKVKEQQNFISLESFLPNAKEVEVFENVPVSDTSEIKVTIDRKFTTSNYREERENSGILKWKTKVPPRRAVYIQLGYKVVLP
ncbi:MAG: mucoidy inhibitor MuiA family protein [Spirochaetota bacterium]